MKYSKVIVAIVIALKVIFAAAVFAVVFAGMEEPEALIIAWYAFTGSELMACAGIKITDNRKISDDEPEE